MRSVWHNRGMVGKFLPSGPDHAPIFRIRVTLESGESEEAEAKAKRQAEQAAAAHWDTYRNRLAEIISVSQLAMINPDFAEYWNEICSLPTGLIASLVKQAQGRGFCAGSDPRLIAVALVSMFNQFCYTQLSGNRTAADVDDAACIKTLAEIFYRTIYHREGQ